MLHFHSSRHCPILRQWLSAEVCKRLHQAVASRPESSLLISFSDVSNLSICKAAKTDLHHLHLSTCVSFFLRVSHFGSPRSASPAKEYATPVVESCRIHSLKCVCLFEGKNIKISCQNKLSMFPDFCKFSHLGLSQMMSCQITNYNS